MAKRSRRERRQEVNKPTRPASSATSATEATTAEASTPVEATRPETTNGRKSGVNFEQEYFYVYQEVRTIFVVAILMFVVLFALSFVI